MPPTILQHSEVIRGEWPGGLRRYIHNQTPLGAQPGFVT